VHGIKIDWICFSLIKKNNEKNSISVRGVLVKWMVSEFERRCMQGVAEVLSWKRELANWHDLSPSS